MKLIVILLTLLMSSCATNDECNDKANQARWDEKERWMTYQLDSIYMKLVAMQMDVKLNRITIDEGFSRVSVLCTKTTTPFYK